MSEQIHKSKIIASLAPRREPYWAAPLAPGRFIGFRKIDAKRGSWIARVADKDGVIAARRKRKPRTAPVVATNNPKESRAVPQRYKALGDLTDKFDYAAACKEARKWFAELDAGVTANERVTVEGACREYVKNREAHPGKGAKTAADAEWRFKKAVYGTAFGRTELSRLQSPAIEKWRQSLGMTPAGVNRMMTTLRAALNLAVTNKQVAPGQREEWRAVKQYKNADGSRKIVLDLPQRRALLNAAGAPGEALRDLIEAALLTGARPGELVAAKRSAFNARTKTLTLDGKTGPREIPLTGSALTFFEHLAKSKLPEALLLTRDGKEAWRRAEWTELVRAAAAAAVVKDENGKVMKDEHGNDAKLPPDVCLYSCRHTFISQAIDKGLSMLDVARFTGTSLLMIDKHYGKASEELRDKLARVQMT